MSSATSQDRSSEASRVASLRIAVLDDSSGIAQRVGRAACRCHRGVLRPRRWKFMATDAAAMLGDHRR